MNWEPFPEPLDLGLTKLILKNAIPLLWSFFFSSFLFFLLLLLLFLFLLVFFLFSRSIRFCRVKTFPLISARTFFAGLSQCVIWLTGVCLERSEITLSSFSSSFAYFFLCLSVSVSLSLCLSLSVCLSLSLSLCVSLQLLSIIIPISPQSPIPQSKSLQTCEQRFFNPIDYAIRMIILLFLYHFWYP